MNNDNIKVISFTIYSLVYELLVWGMVVSAIYFLNWSKWTILTGVILSMSQLKHEHFGIGCKES
jgi:hypothetical protein